MGKTQLVRYGVAGLLAAFLITCASAQSLYRCQAGGSIVYSETPCGANAQRKQLDGQAPSDEDAARATQRLRDNRESAEQSSRARQAADAVRERSRRATVAQAANTTERAAKACVDRYRGHLAYPNGVRIISHNIETDGFGRTLYVQVKTITNPNTAARIDPITLSERFICRLTPQDDIDDRWTEDYVTRHKNGQRL